MARSALKINKSSFAHAASQTVCREATCDNLAIASGYCRMHYIKNWHQIKRKQSILKEGMLQKYISELIDKYPDKFIGGIRHDLSTDENFTAVVRQLVVRESEDDLDIADSDSLDNGHKDIDIEDDKGF